MVPWSEASRADARHLPQTESIVEANAALPSATDRVGAAARDPVEAHCQEQADGSSDRAHSGQGVKQGRAPESFSGEQGQCKRHQRAATGHLQGPDLSGAFAQHQDAPHALDSTMDESSVRHGNTESSCLPGEKASEAQPNLGVTGITLVTASGKPIAAGKNLAKAANLFADLFVDEPSNGDPPLEQARSPALVQASAAFQLTTASGKKVELGQAALQRGQRFMDNLKADSSSEDGRGADALRGSTGVFANPDKQKLAIAVPQAVLTGNQTAAHDITPRRG